MNLSAYRPDELRPMLEQESINLLDMRAQQLFCEGFIPDSVFVPDSWARRYDKLKLLLIPHKPIVVVCPSGDEEGLKTLLAIEGEEVIGFVDGGFEVWQAAGNEIDVVISIDAEELATEIKFGSPCIIDMRRSEEVYNKKHIANAEYIPAEELLERFTEIENEQPVYLYDEDGEGAMAIISFLKRHGLHFFYHIDGGFQAALAQHISMEATEKKE